MVGRDAVHRPPARRERARPRDADGPAPARPLPGLMTPGAVVALQGGAGNAAIARAVIQRHPAAPAQLHTDPSLVQIKPEPGAADPMAIADVMTSEPEVGARTVEHTRMFGCSSKPTNLIFTWRVFDGADRQTKDQMSGLALVLTNEEVRAWELLRDSQQVRMPDGRVVDVYHLLVGLDVLPRKDENRSISRFPGVNRNVGQNYSAATWSGDIAAAAARRRTEPGRQLGEARPERERERQRRALLLNPRRRRRPLWRYRRLGDHRPAARRHGRADEHRRPAERVLRRAVVASHVGVGTGMHVEKRRTAVEQFLRHYGFGFGGGPWAPLVAQPARDDMVHQTFANVWLDNRDYKLLRQPLRRVNEIHRY